MTDEFMQTCNMDERSNEEKLRDMCNEKDAEIDRLKADLEEAKRHAQWVPVSERLQAKPVDSELVEKLQHLVNCWDEMYPEEFTETLQYAITALQQSKPEQQAATHTEGVVVPDIEEEK